jgi:pimeloyl-ACP methyl ester carboxylesterase
MTVALETGDRIHYLDWRPALAAGAEAPSLPPLVLIHGAAATAWAWAPISRRLGKHAPMVAVDLRGHGLSDSPRSGYDIESLAFDVLTVMTALGWGSDADGPPAVAVGHGLGAMVAATMALLRPTSIAALGLVEGGWEEMPAVTGMDAGEYLRTIGDPPEVLASMDAYLADRRDFDPATWDADQERAARAAVDEKHAGHVAPVARPHALRGAVEAMWAYDPANAVGAAATPVLMVLAESGTADDETARERRLAADELVRARAAMGLPTDQLRLAGAGHNVMRYRPVELSAALHELMAKASAYQRS